MKSIKYTPSHFPTGTVVQLKNIQLTDDPDSDDLFTMSVNEGCKTTAVVRRVIVPHWSCDYGVPLLELDVKVQSTCVVKDHDYLVLDTHHLDKILKVGDGRVVIHDEDLKDTKPALSGVRYSHLHMRRVVTYYANKLRPYDWFRISEMADALKRDGVVTVGAPYKEGTYAGSGIQPFKINEKRLRSWMKRNVNRYLATEKEKTTQLAKRREESIRQTGAVHKVYVDYEVQNS